MTSAGHHVMMSGKAAPPAPAYWGLCFTAEEPNVVVNMAKFGSPSAVTLETSTDGVTWTTFDADGGTTPITLAAIGDHVFFRAGAGGNTRICETSQRHRRFSFSGRVSASGSIQSLLDGSTPTVTMDTSVNGTFRQLFSGCSSLTSAPELPATTLANSCYYSMFAECDSLVDAPNLPATTASQYCYEYMFDHCSLLEKGPEIALTTLATACCLAMFIDCQNLKWLQVANSGWTTSTGSNAFSNWVSGVAATGTFRCPTALGTNATITRGDSNCPVGWTVVNV